MHATFVRLFINMGKIGSNFWLRESGSLIRPVSCPIVLVAHVQL